MTLRTIIGRWAFRASNMLGYSPTMFAAIGGRSFGVSSSGVNVTADGAMKVAAFKRAVDLVSGYVGKTPFHVKQKHEKARDHVAWKLVRKWSRYHVISANSFRAAMVAQAMFTGNGVAYIVRDRSTMEPLELRIFPPNTCRPVMVQGRLRYKVEGKTNTISASDVIHIKGFNTDGLWGLDPITGYANDVLGLSIAQQTYAASYYEHGGAPSTWAHSEAILSDDEYNSLNKRLNEKGGLQNAVSNSHEIPICEGFELKSLNPTAAQAQILEAREFGLKDISNITGVSVHKLQGDGKSSYKSLEEENRAFGNDTLDGWFCQFEEQYDKLLTEDEQDSESHRVEAVREALTRTTMKDKAEYLSKAIGGPWMTPAEGRDVDSLPDKDGTDELLKPLNMTPRDQQPETDSDSDDDEDEDDKELEDNERSALTRKVIAEQRALADVYRRMNKRLTTQAVRAAGKSQSFPEFLEGLHERNAATVSAALEPVAGIVTGQTDLRFVEHVDSLASDHIAAFGAQLQRQYDSAKPDEFASAIADTCDAWERSAADHAAATQLALAS